MKFRVILLILMCISLTGENIFAQKDGKQHCQADIKGGKYTRAKIIEGFSTPGNFSGYVLVKLKQVNKEFLVKLAARLKSEYCHADKIMVGIFDNFKLIRYAGQNYEESGGKIIHTRGYYTFDRQKGIETLEFSQKLGDPTDEVKIDLTKE